MEKQPSLLEMARAKLAPKGIDVDAAIAKLKGPLKPVFDELEKEVTDKYDLTIVQSLLVLSIMWETADQIPGFGQMIVHTSMKYTAAIMRALTDGDKDGRIARLFDIVERTQAKLQSAVTSKVADAAMAAGMPGGGDYSKL